MCCAHTKLSLQELNSWRPVLTLHVSYIIFGIGTVFFFIIGPLLLVESNNAIEVIERYDDKCTNIPGTCNITLHIPKKMEGRIMFSYELTKYYQAHRRWVTSRNDEQLQGEYIEYDDLVDCKPLRSVDDDPDPKKWLLPSGLSANTIFNDTFKFPSHLNFVEEGIAWKTDKKINFKELNAKYTGIRWLQNDYPQFLDGITNEHFMVWMRAGSIGTIRKLYAVCEKCTIEKGDLDIEIEVNYPMDGFTGVKDIVILVDTILGSKNPWIGVAAIVVASVLLILLVILVVQHLVKPRKPGDPKLILETIEKLEKNRKKNFISKTR